MSATTLALSLPEIVTRVFVHLAEPSSWVASTVNVLWWQSAQHAALLTRARVCSDPDAVGVHLLDALLSGPKEAGESVRHLSLSTGIEPDAINTPLFQPLGQFAAFMARKTLERCRNVTSVAVHGLDYGEAGEELIELIKKHGSPDKLNSLHLVGTIVNLSHFAWNIEFPNLRHLTITGQPSPAVGYSLFDQLPTGVGFGATDMDYDPPTLGLTMLTLTNVGRRLDGDQGRGGRGGGWGGGGGGRDGLPGSAMAWLLRTATGPEPPASTDDTDANPDTANPPSTLRDLRYLLDDAEPGVLLSGDAIAAIARHAPALERAELWLTQDNVNNDLETVLDMLDLDGLKELKLRLFVAENRLAKVPGARGAPGRGEAAKARAKLGKRVARLAEGKRARVTILD